MSLKGTRIERAIYDEVPSLAVVSAVADVTGNEPTELDPLYWTVDPDALDALFETDPAGPHRTGGQVNFTFHGCDVVVHEDRKVVVERPESSGTIE
ncbi:HalOD1 output domain-containing protein [Halosimplex salinum]|uniref:HalOD1 output domain-containing protein n=1 Tax=Halosimplex salinum TaxID=1710538 RepID=UPI000F4A64AF|nr:HalOD1 output domain-containing protein [Halosimplex salinum]